MTNQESPKILVYTGLFPWENISKSRILSNDLIGGNTGNLLFSWSTLNIFSDVPHENFTKVYITLENQLINYEFDYFLLPLANTFRENNDEELIFLISLLKKISCKVLLNGIGGQFGKVGFHKFSNEQLIREFIELLIEKTTSIGVRDERTKEYITEFLGYSEAEVVVIGCPSVRILNEKLHAKEYLPFNADFKLAINYTPGSYDRKWGHFIDSVFKNYDKSYAVFQDLDEGELISHGKNLVGLKRHDLIPTFTEHSIIKEQRYRLFVNPIDWIDEMHEFQFSIGTRIHGNIAAILAGVPALVIAIDSRTAGLAQTHHIPYIWFDELTDKTRIEELYYRSCTEMTKFYTHLDENNERYFGFIKENLGLDVRA